MEGEVFAKDLTGAGVLARAPGPVEHMNGIGGMSKHDIGNNDPRKPWEAVQLDPSLKPKSYQIKGTPKESRILVLDVNIFDSTGSLPFNGDVYIEGERIKYVGTVPNIGPLLSDPGVKVLKGRGRTLMSGLGDAHTHLSWNSGDIPALGGLGIEEHTLMTARSAQTAIDSGYTMCFGAAAAQNRLDVVVRDAINDGKIPGPRYLANCKEITRTQDDVGQNGLAAIADGPDEMRDVVGQHIDFGADQVKLTMSGEEICEPLSSEKCYFTDEETAACVEVAHSRGKRLCAHARARDSVKMCVKHGVDVIFHASWTDDEGMNMLEANKHKHVVAPAINWLYATLYESEFYGYAMSEAERDGYKREFANAKIVLKEMHRRGITVLPGGDYGFAWTPHGTYARDLEHFVNWFGFTPLESLLAATAGVAKLFMREDELGKILPGYFADCIMVDGDPLQNISILQDHSKLNLITINGRIHKASQTDFMTTIERNSRFSSMASIPRTLNGHDPARGKKFTNFVAYRTSQSLGRVGHLDLDDSMITPLGMPSGCPLTSLYELLELDEEPIAGGTSFSLSSVTLLPPLSGRDILAVGKNYVDHAQEFHTSGYDSSDKIAQPSHPVIFTKRYTSIVASGANIVLHPKFTQTLDYEGEIGVIIGKAGIGIEEHNAMDHVWGYTIINDVTAREVQRDHKQFFLGKSGETYCPMGPIAVPAASLPKLLRLQTSVNGVIRQEATSDDLIFSIPKLISVISKGAVLQIGDVIATGTPAGVGLGQTPPSFLQPGDVVEVAISGLGTLRNQVVQAHVAKKASLPMSHTILPTFNTERSADCSFLTRIESKMVNVEVTGQGSVKAVFIHGLGGSTEFYGPLMKAARLHEAIQCYSYDLEGHGLSPTDATSVVSIQSYIDDLYALFLHHESILKSAILVAHSMGSLIALGFVSQHPELVEKLILLAPARYPVPATAAGGQQKRAAAVRSGGMRACADTVATNGTSAKTKTSNPTAYAAVHAILMSQSPVGYAKACTALGAASAFEVDFSRITMPVLIVAGDEDKVSPLSACESLQDRFKDSRLDVLSDVGHWSALEDPFAVGNAIREFLELS